MEENENNREKKEAKTGKITFPLLWSDPVSFTSFYEGVGRGGGQTVKMIKILEDKKSQEAQ